MLVVSTLYFAQETGKDKKCDLPANCLEPTPDKKIQSFLKKVDATIEDLRKHVALDNDCNESDVFYTFQNRKQTGFTIYVQMVSL